jgi:predicted enzyme related to lactoylglutathione lyase
MTSDMKAAEAFYGTVVGWKTSPFDAASQPYTMFNRSGDIPVAGVMTKPDEVKAPPFWAMGPMGKYQMFNRPHGMIGGMMNKPPEMANVPPNWQIYFRVPDVHSAATRVTANGGKILNGPMEVPGGDWVVNAMDPQGAALGLHARRAQ